MSYFGDREGLGVSLPSPTDTPYSTPVPSLSRRSSRYASTSPGPSSPFSQDGFSTGVDNTSIDETLPLSDPRRFTPTLHASLVSQILNLQRELDSKHKFIDELETHLESTKTENEELSTKLRQTSRENKTVKQHLEQIEGGTLAALEELAKERDQTKEINEELKTKVDSFQKKIKTQEEESVRVHDQWQNEKEEWDNAKRGLERRVHATETRLKIILTELEAQQAHDHHAEHEAEDHGRESVAGNESDTASISSMNRTSSITRGGRHRRNMSSSSHRSIGRNWRFSTVSGAGSEGFAKLNGGLSLADELNFDEEDEDELEYLEDDDDEFAEHELRARRALESRQSMYPDEKAKRILGLMGAESRTIQSEHPQGQTSDDIPRPRKSSVVDEFLPSSILARHEPITLPAEGSRPSSPIKRPLSPVKRPASPAKRPVSPTKRPPSPVKPKIQYVDTAIQYSPPPSPPIVSKPTEPTIGAADIEANQRRKRISASPSATNLKQSTNQQQKRTMSMVSSSSQTVEPPLSPPATPSLSGPPSPQLPASAFHAETANVATQTDPVEEQPVHMEPPPRSPMRIAPPPPILIPSIAIIPPVSAPTSPKEPRLPTGTKSASCQTSSNELGSTRDSSMQTEAISVDRRLAKLPPHLLPSAVRSKPGTPEPALKKPIITINGDIPDESVQKSQQQSPVEKPNSASGAPVQSEPPPIPRYATQTRQNEHIVRARAAASSAKKAEVDSSILRKPYNASTLFAGFNGASSDEDDDDVDASDDESWMEHTIQDARTHTFRNKLGKRPMGSPPTPVPEEKESAGSAGKTVVASGKAREIDSLKRLSREISPTRRSSLEKPAKVSKPVRQSNLGRQLSIRRSAMIQNGAAAHQRPRSPSAGSHEAEINHILMKPPFPVPTRSSSRRLPLSKSEGSQSPTPGSGLGFANRFGRGAGARHSRNDSLRKIRSAAVIPKTGRVNGRPRSRSPPLPSPTFDGADLPPLPRDMVAAPQSQKPFFLHRHQPSNNTFNTATGSIGSSVQSSSVVDAITATAVGEWMWKYVRRRKSFNVPESPLDPKTGEEGTGGVRHKRWVWLSPYERSVMWSSKQPTSGTALLGKNGRKLTIQSVLDVSDNTPLPKNLANEEVFNRSILILTPQRALKFTATSRDRHYLWLTALSFLAHSNNNAPEIPSAPSHPPPIPVREPEQPQHRSATMQRARIRDSVRLAKDKTNPVLARQYSGPVGAQARGYNANNWDYPLPEIADAPSVPRFGHGRKRSSTGPRVPPPSVFRGFSHHQPVPSMNSTVSSEMYGPSPSIPPSVPSTIYNPSSIVTSGRTSEASTSTRHNFFDAMGTVRMEAFVDRMAPRPSEDTSVTGSSVYNPRPRPPPKMTPHTRTGGLYDEFVYDGASDPFRGF